MLRTDTISEIDEFKNFLDKSLPEMSSQQLHTLKRSTASHDAPETRTQTATNLANFFRIFFFIEANDDDDD